MRVVFLPKAGKEDYAVAKSYRPITLSNFVLKGLERIIQWFILEYTITKPLTNQHAYTKGRSCDSALSCFVNDVEKTIYNGQHLLAVSLDCSGAFDNIRFEAARRCMETQKIPYNIIRWYGNLLKSRSVQAQVQGLEKTIKPSRGSPQGGVLSPLVWNIIMDSFLSQYKKGPVKALGYADDILLYVTGTDMNVMEEFLQESMDKVLEWGNSNGLSFNPKKTQMVLFTNKRKLQSPKVKMGDMALELRDSFKCLGVEIHKRLSWNKHVTDRVNKCRGLLFKCKGNINRRWGLNPTKVDWIYKAIIRPKVTPTKTPPIWAARKWRITGAGTQNLRHRDTFCSAGGAQACAGQRKGCASLRRLARAGGNSEKRKSRDGNEPEIREPGSQKRVF